MLTGPERAEHAEKLLLSVGSSLGLDGEVKQGKYQYCVLWYMQQGEVACSLDIDEGWLFTEEEESVVRSRFAKHGHTNNSSGNETRNRIIIK